jgi:hypothetical protein
MVSENSHFKFGLLFIRKVQYDYTCTVVCQVDAGPCGVMPIHSQASPSISAPSWLCFCVTRVAVKWRLSGGRQRYMYTIDKVKTRES